MKQLGAFLTSILSYFGLLTGLFYGAVDGWSKNSAYDTSEEYLWLFVAVLILGPIVQFFLSRMYRRNGQTAIAAGISQSILAEVLIVAALMFLLASVLFR